MARQGLSEHPTSKCELSKYCNQIDRFFKLFQKRKKLVSFFVAKVELENCIHFFFFQIVRFVSLTAFGIFKDCLA